MKKLLPVLAVVSAALLIFFRADAMVAARNGIMLWKEYVLPALLPYFILISIFLSRDVPCNNITLFFLSVLSGAPSGAKLCSYIETDDIGQVSALCAILNTVSPMFIYSSFCCEMLKLPALALPIIFAQTFSAALMLYIYNRKKHLVLNMRTSARKKGIAILATTISASVNALLSICGAMIFFAVIMSILKVSGILNALAFPFEWVLNFLGANARIVKPVLYGMLEITTGAAELAKSGLNVAETAFCGGFIFSFGGLSILAQSALFVDIDIKRYVSLKLISALVTGVLAFIVSLLISEPYTAAFANDAQSTVMQNASSFIIIFIASALCQASVLLICEAYKKRRRSNRAPHVDNLI